MPVTIRQALPDDAPTIADFNRRMALETEDKLLDPAILAAGVAAALADPHKAVYYLAVEEGPIVGQLSITREWSDWRNGWFWWIQSVYVRPEARRRGIYRALYAHVRARARQQGDVLGLRLYVEEENATAEQTYLRLGMEPAGYRLLQQYPLSEGG